MLRTSIGSVLDFVAGGKYYQVGRCMLLNPIEAMRKLTHKFHYIVVVVI